MRARTRFLNTAPYRQSITEWGVRLSLSPPSFLVAEQPLPRDLAPDGAVPVGARR